MIDHTTKTTEALSRRRMKDTLIKLKYMIVSPLFGSFYLLYESKFGGFTAITTRTPGMKTRMLKTETSMMW